jgi:hypothetical protein
MTVHNHPEFKAWLSEVRADADLVNRYKFSEDGHEAAMQSARAWSRLAAHHAPTMLRMLEGIEELIAPKWRSMGYKRDDLLDDLRKVVDEARGLM